MADKRLANIRHILKYYTPKTVPQHIIDKINKKFPKTKYYTFINTNDIDERMLLCTVTLDLKTLHIIGIVLKITYTYDKQIETVLLFNPYKNLYWNINPSKYYLFSAISNKELFSKQMFDDYKASILSKYKNGL